MKVGILSIGALSHYCYCLANALADAGLHVVLYTDQGYSFDAYETNFTVRKIMGSSRNFWQWKRELIADIVREKIDLVHMQSYRKYLVLDIVIILLLKRTGVALAYTFHDLSTFKRDVKSYATTAHHNFALKYFFLPLFEGYIAHSTTSQREIRKRYDLRECDIAVIPHGIMDFYNFGAYTRQTARRVLNLAEDDFVLLYFGNIGKRKGLEYLLRAHRDLRQRGYINVKLLLAGSGKKYYRRHLRALSKEGVLLYLELERIPNGDVELLFKGADLVVLPYVESTTSGNLKIAIAFGKPVIATSIGEFPEYFGKYAVDIVKPKDAMGIAESVIRMMEIRGMMQKGQNKLPGHGWSEIAGKTRKFYEKTRRNHELSKRAHKGRNEYGTEI